jgi:hypothetical protein
MVCELINITMPPSYKEFLATPADNRAAGGQIIAKAGAAATF